MITLYDIIKDKNPGFSDDEGRLLSKRLLLLFQLSQMQEDVCRDVERTLKDKSVYRCTDSLSYKQCISYEAMSICWEQQKARRSSMRVGLVDVDGHNFPNLALMKISRYHKDRGDLIEWADALFGRYDKVYQAKVFTFSEDEMTDWGCETVYGGTGYDVKSVLPADIESMQPDYGIYAGKYRFSIQFFSRGCIRHCPFCLVRDKEGGIRSVEPMELNPLGEWIEVLDNNFFANPEWMKAVEWLLDKGQPVNLHGVDVRIMDEEQAYWLNRLRLKTNIHIAWDLPDLDLTGKLMEITKYIKPYKLTCYVLVGFNSTVEQDLYRLNRLKELGILPFVQPYRDFGNRREPSQYELDLARWANRAWLFKSCDFKDYKPRKGFKCKEYFYGKDLC